MDKKTVEYAEYRDDKDGRRTFLALVRNVGLDYTTEDLEADLADGSMVEFQLGDGKKALHFDDGAFTGFAFPGVVLGPNNIWGLWKFLRDTIEIR